MHSKIVGIIPARYQSSRFPGKPLALISGTSLIQRTYENAKRAPSLSDVIVATDDKRIFDHVLSFGGKVVMTSKECLTGSDRIAEVAKNLPDAEIIVNIQGDEPCLEPQDIEMAVQGLINDPQAVVSTAATPLTYEEGLSSSIVKCVFDQNNRALYFSRSLIPGSKDKLNGPFYKHVGLYVYRKDFLLQYADLAPTPLMIAEDLEQLKVLEHGYSIHIVTVNGTSLGVDLPEDIEKVEKYLCQ